MVAPTNIAQVVGELLTLPEQSLEKAFNRQGDAKICSSVQKVRDYVETKGDGFKTIFELLATKIIKSGKAEGKGQALRIFAWIYRSSSREKLFQYAAECLTSDNKKTKLALLMGINFANRHSAKLKTQGVLMTESLDRRWEFFCTISQLFCEVMIEDSAVNPKSGHRTDTLLSSLASSVFIDLLSTLVNEQDEFLPNASQIEATCTSLGTFLGIQAERHGQYMLQNVVKITRQLLESIRANKLAGQTDSDLLSGLILCIADGFSSEIAYSSVNALVASLKTTISTPKIVNSSPLERSLAISMLHEVVACNGAQSIDSILPSLMFLLDEEYPHSIHDQDCDPMLRAMSAILAELAVSNPEEVLHQLFQRIDSADRHKRLNALAALKIMSFDCQHSISNVIKVNMRLRDTLYKLLNDRLADDDVQLRTLTASLFTGFEPDFVLSRLAVGVLHRDVKYRSASENALVATLCSFGSKPDGILAYIDFVRTSEASPQLDIMTIPNSPAEISARQPRTSKKDIDYDRFFRVVKLWAEKLDDQSWANITARILGKVYACPQDPLLPTVSTTFLTGELVIGDDFARNELLFHRLSPILMLKVIPVSILSDLYLHLRSGPEGDDADLLNEILCSVFERAENKAELENVRKVCCEFVAKMPLPLLLPLLEQKLARTDHLRSTTINFQPQPYLYIFVNMFQWHEASCDQWLHLILSTVVKLLIHLQNAPSSEDSDKVQRGCVDCLSALVMRHAFSEANNSVSGSRWKKQLITETHPNNVKLPSSTKVESFEEAFEIILRLLHPRMTRSLVTTSNTTDH
ncbi:hypothetical protein HDU76_013462, partial [Blyttiomyces sp. JEL0837]